jgi:ribonuclease HI
MLPHVTIYTDGGAEPNPGLGGWGALLLFTKSDGTLEEKELYGAQDDTTNNVMELTAPIRALEALKVRCRVTLHADSQYVVKGMNEWLAGWKRKGWMRTKSEPVKNVELWQRLDELSHAHNVTFVWVKGHDGIVYNERVDALVHRARAEHRKLK